MKELKFQSNAKEEYMGKDRYKAKWPRSNLECQTINQHVYLNLDNNPKQVFCQDN